MAEVQTQNSQASFIYWLVTRGIGAALIVTLIIMGINALSYTPAYDRGEIITHKASGEIGQVVKLRCSVFVGHNGCLYYVRFNPNATELTVMRGFELTTTYPEN